MTLEWMIITLVLSVGVTAMAMFYATQTRLYVRKLVRYGELQKLLLKEAKAAYGKQEVANSESTEESAVYILYRIEQMSKNLSRRDYSKLQIDLLNEILSLNETFFRSLLLKKLAETCIDRGNVDIGKTALSHITDERVIENCNYLSEVEQRRISRMNLVNYMSTEEASSAVVEDNVTKFRR